MTDKQIIIENYFNIINDDMGRTIGIQEISDPRELIKAIREQNEQLARKTQECEELKIKLMQKDEVNTFFNTPIEGWPSNPCDICESKNNYEQLKHECEELKEKLNTAQFNFEQKCNVLKDIGVVQDNNGGYQIPELNLYRKALKEVEGMLQVIVKTNNVYPLQSNLYKILDIINKAKGETNE